MARFWHPVAYAAEVGERRIDDDETAAIGDLAG
jgi:hypothetical protein